MSSLILPSPFSNIPRRLLLFGFLPLHRLDRISEDLSAPLDGYKVNVYAKREDCNSELAFGGNKTRKLEYLILGSSRTGRRHAAAKYGSKAKLVQEHWVDYPSPVYDQAGNIQLSKLMGALPHLDSPSALTFGIEHKPTAASQQVLKIAKETGAKIRLGPDEIGEEDVILDERYHAGTYRIPDERTVEAIRVPIWMPLSPTPVYEGKSLAGMIEERSVLAKERPSSMYSMHI
ncbi:hypothetical protein D9757_006456 [Collybiopsis confluens]|uniref:Uncharacterized protein n=1 Tax=Collybiopsis confluens TaxID=2823264 RepID=A0A8H5HJH4_9AGAR|nr:hypothetical protein D9757_006456 [Collybiopsis confluens]